MVEETENRELKTETVRRPAIISGMAFGELLRQAGLLPDKCVGGSITFGVSGPVMVEYRVLADERLLKVDLSGLKPKPVV